MDSKRIIFLSLGTWIGILWFTAESFVSAAQTNVTVDLKACVEQTNGCSVPLQLPFPYKLMFEPACIRHDICYACGIRFGWSRSECDIAFRRNMEELCHLKESTKNPFSDTIYHKLKSALIVAKGIASWLLLKSDSLRHCLNGANVYFHAVDGFGKSRYRLVSRTWCDLTCAEKLGNPNFLN